MPKRLSIISLILFVAIFLLCFICSGCDRMVVTNAASPNPEANVTSGLPAAGTASPLEIPELPTLPESNTIVDKGTQNNSLVVAENYIYALEYEGDLVRTLYRTAFDTGKKEVILEHVINDIELSDGGFIYMNAYENGVWEQYTQGADLSNLLPALFCVDVITGESVRMSEALYGCSLLDRSIVGFRVKSGYTSEYAICRIDEDGLETLFPGRYGYQYAIAFVDDVYAYLYDWFSDGEQEILRVSLTSGKSETIAQHGIPYEVTNGTLYYTEQAEYTGSPYGRSMLYALDLTSGKANAVLVGEARIEFVGKLNETLLIRAVKEHGTWYFSCALDGSKCERLFKEDAYLMCVHNGYIYYVVPQEAQNGEVPHYSGVYRMRVGESGSEKVYDGVFTQICTFGDTLCVATFYPKSKTWNLAQLDLEQQS